MQVPFNDLKKLHDNIRAELKEVIDSAIDDNNFIAGDLVKSFESNFSKYCGVKKSCGVGNGTDAILLALAALNLKAGDEIIIPAQSFIATIEPIFYLGLKPVFVDIEEGSYLLDVTKLEASITAKTKAIIAVNLYGNVADFDSLNKIAKKHNIIVIEDSAQAHGAEYNNIKSGNLCDIAVFSFYPGKNLGAFGDAGMVCSNNEEMISYVKALSNHGRIEGDKYVHSYIGFNSRLDAIQAAILNVKLKYLDKWVNRRRQIAAIYDRELAGIVATPKVKENVKHAYHLYVINTENRDALQQHLQSKNIQTVIHYPDPLHTHKSVIDKIGDQTGKFPIAEKQAKNILSLPIFPDMTDEQILYVCKSIKEFL